MKTIWKLVIPHDIYPVLNMPENADILCVQMQHNYPTIWFTAESNDPIVSRRFLIVGTGHEMPDKPMNYIGTWQLNSFVFHLFELI